VFSILPEPAVGDSIIDVSIVEQSHENIHV
jgi:hypothetical protein